MESRAIATTLATRRNGRARNAAPRGARRRPGRSALWLLLGLVLAVALVMGFVGSAILTVIRGVHSPLGGQVSVPKPGQRVNVLFLGLDAAVDGSGRVIDVPLRESRSRTDTMILASLNPETREASLISIPRDTRAFLPGWGWDKINAAHVWGGPLLAMQAVEHLLGIPVHYYIRTNFEGVRAVVEALGGVRIDVEMDMEYEDPVQNLVIDLKKGSQMLDGDQALQYLRYRNGGGDIARIGRQQKFIAAVVRQAVSVGTLLRAQSLARELIKYIDTNLTTTEILDFALLASRIDDPELETATLPGSDKWITDPGRPQLSYWVLDEEATERLTKRMVWDIDPDENAGVRVRVLNGCGVNGAAAQMAAKLEADGFQVVAVGNAEDYSADAETQVVVHTSDAEPGKRVVRSVLRYAEKAGLFSDVLGDVDFDVTVVVGKDFTLAQR